MNTATLRSIAAAAAFAAASSSMATEALFKNTTGDGDLANPANWDPSSWAAGDTLLISSDNFAFPSEATPQDTLHLSADMPASGTIRFGKFPKDSVTIDFAGKSLNTTNLVYIRAEPGRILNAVGGFSDVKYFALTNNLGNLRFTDGVFRVQNGFVINRWSTEVHVCSGAELVVENIWNDIGVGILVDDSHSAKFVVDGGKFIIQGRRQEFYKRAQWRSRTDYRSGVEIINGGEYRDDSRNPVNMFIEANLTIKDSGYYETNSASVQGNAILIGSGAKREITNSTFRVAQLYCGPISKTDYNSYSFSNLSSTLVDFCDSEETFAFAPDSALTTAGMVVPSTANNNTIRFRGEKNRFTSKTFVLGGSNTVAVTDGSFAVSNVFEFVSATEGKGSRLLLKDADVYLGSITSAASSTNALVEVSGAAHVTGGNFAFSGPASTMRVLDNAVVDLGVKKIRLAGNGSTLSLSGLASTGCVEFAASNCRAVIADTTHATKLGPDYVFCAPFSFAAGQANNVLVISNATFRCGSYAFKSDISTGTGDHEVRPFTGCPGCAIELRGSHPKLIFPTGSAHANGGGYFTMAFGEMIDPSIGANGDYTTEPYALDNPLRLRFVLPPSTDVYAEPPVQSSVQTLCLGGNAEFEFDMSEYDWPVDTVTFPLISCAKGFKATKPSGTRTYIDVDQLNETNSDRLPVDRHGRRVGRLVLSADGTTLCLVVNNVGPTVITLR